jgi:hypothetical protein
MGKKLSKFIPASAAQKSAGTWTPTLASNVLADVRSAADAAFTIYVPINLVEQGQAYRGGAKIESIDVFYKIATAAADDFATVELEKCTLPATGTAITGAAVTVTCDTGHDTAAERYAVASHTMTITPSADLYVEDDYYYVLTLVVDAAATTVFTLFGVRVNLDYPSY